MIIATTKRLILESFNIDDVNEYYSVISDYSIRKYVPSASPFTKRGLYNLISKYCKSNFVDDFYVIIKHKNSNKIIGSIQAYKILTPNSLHVSYLIKKACRNNGFMKEALGAFINYLFFSKKMYNFLQFVIEKDNVASKSTVESLGAQELRDFDSHIVYGINLNS